SFQLFGQVFVLTGGGPGDATRTVVQHLYETAFQNFFQFGAASAMAWVLFAIVLGFSVLQFRLLRGHTEYWARALRHRAAPRRRAPCYPRRAAAPGPGVAAPG